MEIIYVEDAMLRNLFLAAVDLFYPIAAKKELFWRRRRKKNDCGKLNGNSKGRRLSKMSSTKLKPTIIHGLCRKLKTAKRDLR